MGPVHPSVLSNSARGLGRWAVVADKEHLMGTAPVVDHRVVAAVDGSPAALEASSGLLLGSVGNVVAVHAACPVLVVHAPVAEPSRPVSDLTTDQRIVVTF